MEKRFLNDPFCEPSFEPSCALIYSIQSRCCTYEKVEMTTHSWHLPKMNISSAAPGSTATPPTQWHTLTRGKPKTYLKFIFFSSFNDQVYQNCRLNNSKSQISRHGQDVLWIQQFRSQNFFAKSLLIAKHIYSELVSNLANKALYKALFFGSALWWV